MRSCPRCRQKLPFVRVPRSMRELVAGGWTCRRCGCWVDPRGREIPQGGGSGEAAAGVQVELRFFPLSWQLYFSTPTIVVDGEAHPRYWGTHFLALEPGRHTIRIYFRYLLIAECGANSIDVIIE